ncbi:hypothetical protein RB298_27285 [Priestia sp. BR_2]
MAVPQTALHIHNPGRDVQLPNPKVKLPEGNIVETYTIGESTIHICDDYMARTPEEKDKVIKNMHEKAWAIIRDLQEKGEAL